MLNLAASFTRTDVRVVTGGGLLVGGVTGYLIAKKTLTNKFRADLDARMDQETEAIRDMYKRRYKEGEYADTESTSAVLTAETPGGLDISPVVPKTDYQNAVEELGYSSTDEDPNRFSDVNKAVIAEEDAVVVHANGGQVVVRVQDHLEERHTSVDVRNSERPYVITREEFEDGEVGHEAVTFSWWEGDKTLADEQEKIVTDVDGTVGRENLSHFGKGSDDARVVYIRNEKVGLDFEVVRENGLYSVEVAGEDPPETFQRIRRPQRPSDDV